MRPIVSIIIVNYNTGEFLRRCIQSIKETTKNLSIPGCEVIIVDNASSDKGVTSIVNTVGTTGIRIIQNKENVGFARAVNRGIKKAEGKYILLLNPDTEVKDGAIAKLVEFAQETRNVGVVGTRLLNPDGLVQSSVFRFPTFGRAIHEFWLDRKVYSKYAPDGNIPVRVDAVVGAAFLITPVALKEVGMLDEHYFMYFEDLDYCRRVKKAGLKVYYLPQAQVVHHHGVSGRGLVEEENQWRRLVPASKIYHGTLKHYLINAVIWSGQKWQRILKKL
ncbi:MAG: glycosyltransferase family 2 protein [bacterium]|nr:glycosyltransferase family 2 protein [bacterium]